TTGTAAATLTAPAASPTGTEAGPEGEAGATETGTAETGPVREAGQTFRRERRATVLGEAAGAEATTTEAAAAVLVVAAVLTVLVVFTVVVMPAAASFANAFAEGAAHVVERVVPGLSAWIEWIVTHG
ncbi:MAG TPA: hypothetical protein VGN81_19740, partial [Pseudonocardiaceae bacterium]